MPRTARSRSADGATMAALLPPSSSSSLPNRPATSGATALPIRVEPVAEISATRGSSTSASPTSAPPSTQLAEPGRARRPGAAACSEQRLAGQRGEQRLLRRLPHHRVAADEGQRGVPRPDRDREVERADDADDAERVPLLHHPVARAARRRSSGRTAAGTARPRGRRCRSSPGPRRGPRSVILPASMDTSAPRSSLCSRSSSPSSRTSAPRTGAGTSATGWNASCAAPTISATCSAVCAAAGRVRCR